MSNRAIFEIQAELWRVMGNPLRVEIMFLLHNGPLNVNDIASALGTCQSTISRNLTALRHAGMVSTHRERSNIAYRISNPKVMALCDLMREVLMDQIGERASLIGPGEDQPS